MPMKLKYSKAVVYRMKTWGHEVVGDADISFPFLLQHIDSKV